MRRFQDMDTDASKSIDFDEMLAYYQPWLKPAAAGSGPAGAERGIRSFLENQMVQLQREPAQEGPTRSDAYTSPQLTVPPVGSAGFAGAANAGHGPCPSGGNTTGVGSGDVEVLAPAEGAADGASEGMLLGEARIGDAAAPARGGRGGGESAARGADGRAHPAAGVAGGSVCLYVYIYVYVYVYVCGRCRRQHSTRRRPRRWRRRPCTAK